MALHGAFREGLLSEGGLGWPHAGIATSLIRGSRRWGASWSFGSPDTACGPKRTSRGCPLTRSNLRSSINPA